MACVDRYGFDFDGSTYVENNNLDLTQDFTIATKIVIPTIINTGVANDDLQYINGQYLGQSGNMGSGFGAYFGYSETFSFLLGAYDTTVAPPPTITKTLTSQGDINTIVIGCRSGKIFVMIDGVVEESIEISDFSTFEQSQNSYGVFNHYTLGHIRFFKNAMLEILEIQDTLTDAQLLEFSDLDKFSDHPNYATFNKNAYYDFNNQNTLDYSGNGNTGVVVGTEQYTIVSTECINGELFKRHEKTTIEATDNYEWLISDWVYGGDMTITVNDSGTKTITTAIYDVKEERYFPIDVQTTTMSSIEVALRNYEARNMLITVESDTTFTELTYKIEHITPVTLHNDSLQTNMIINDLYVLYPRNQFIHKNITARVGKEYSNLFKTIIEKKLYFQEKDWIVTSSSMQPVFDLDNYYFDLNLVRLL